MTKRIEISKAKLRHLYEEEELSQREIAKIFGCSQRTVWNRMQEHGIRTRANAEAKIIAHGYKNLRRDFDGDPRKKAYLIGFCKGDAHVKLLCEGGQTIRVDCSSTKSEQIELLKGLFSPYKNIKKRDAKGWTHVNITETELRHLYEEEELSQEQIAKVLGCSPTTLGNRMRKYGIKARSLSEAAIIARSRGKSI